MQALSVGYSERPISCVTGSDQVNEDRILDKLEAIDTQGGQALVEIRALQEQIKALPDHETRIRALEQWRWGLVGVSTLLATGFTTYASAKGGA